MSELKFCPDCGSELVPNDRFCGDCGFDTQSLAAPVHTGQLSESRPVQTPAPAAVKTQPIVPAPPPDLGQQLAAGNFENMGRKSTDNKKALLIMISLLGILFLAGGGAYWWLSRGDQPETGPSVPTAAEKTGISTSREQPVDLDTAGEFDLTRASTYLSEPGLKCTFLVNYPDGTSGVVERISARVVPNEAVRVTEVETGVEQGEAFGYGFHYVERPDGTYYILDQSPMEIFPVLKNNLSVGQSWNYQNEFGQITWTVLDMGVDLDLGITNIEDCLLVQEDNQMAEYQSITYYAPGRGIVLVKDLGGAMDYYNLTAIAQIDLSQAEETVIKWCPNYYDIKDDRTQS